MNKLKPEKQAAIIAALVEGASIRSVERMTGVHRDTIMRLVIRVGNACERLMDEKMRDLPCADIQVDEIWCYVGKKQRHVTGRDNVRHVGNFWTWVAIDADTKLVPTYMVSKRDTVSANIFMADLAHRLRNRVQISSDRMGAYVDAVASTFGEDVDYGRIVKTYETEPAGPGRYSPPKVVKVERDVVFGNPDPSRISTSYVERQNLTMRMSMRRFTRLTNGFSKKFENLEAAVAVHFAHYNFVRKHQSIRTTPAVAVGIEERSWTLLDLIEAAAL
jgi:transposase-like protein